MKGRSPRREPLFVDNLAAALKFLLQAYSEQAYLNVGTGKDMAISELAGLITEVVGFNGRLALDPSKPDGTPRAMDAS